MEDLIESEEELVSGLDDVKCSLFDIGIELCCLILFVGFDFGEIVMQDVYFNDFNRDYKCLCEDNSYLYFINIWERLDDFRDYYYRRRIINMEFLLVDFLEDYFDEVDLGGGVRNYGNYGNYWLYFVSIWERFVDFSD